MKPIYAELNRYSRTLLLFGAGLMLLASALLPVLLPRGAGAAQLTSRSLQITSGVPGASSVQYKFTFTVVATSTVQSLKIQFCTTAIGSCTGTAGTNIPNVGSAAWVSQNSW